jgi:hypothetical protein
MIGRRALGLALAALAASSACAEQKERPTPYTSQCSGLGCLPPHVGTRPPPPGSGGGDGGGNEGGAAGAGEEVTLTGVVGLLADATFEGADTFPEFVDLRAESPRAASVVGLWTGNVSDPFVIEGVLRAPAVWVHGRPRAGGADALPTLQPMSTDNPDDAGVVHSESPFVLVRASVIEEIFSLASTPVLPDENAAQVVLQLVTGSARDGLAGIEVTAPQAEVVMYGVNGSFSDIPEETDGSGLVLLGNIPASPWPGRTLSVSFAGARASSIELPVMTGSVTIVPIEP